MAEMSERRRLILKLVIQEYIEQSLPVSSELLVRKYGLKFSTATIRNELAALEDQGFLTHLHTSAGRVPTDAGYRYFVENLMERTPLSAAEQRTIRHQFYQVRSELDQWIHLAGAVLARTAQNASVVTPPRAYQARFKHLELIAIHDSTVLLVLVLHDGTIRQQTLTLDAALSQEDLSRLASRINETCNDAALGRVQEAACQERASTPPAQTELEQQVLDLIVKAMQQLEDQHDRAIHSDGLIEILGQPEFTDVDRVRKMVEILQGGKRLNPLIARVLASNGVQVLIGGEHGHDEMREYSVVLSRYGVNDEVAGVVGIIGPTRMPYPRTISTVRYISSLMSDLLGDIYGDRRAET
ncbi:MAG TPA: heat-inducible transcriptional repressor HrcA [Roseiflexaceae bacterium]|nr:heat-inducible transcriptional repressor HrcA [Roseiflexaceae bacterium]